MSQKIVADVLSGRHKFSIPQYQRDYAWKRNNFEELWEDLKEAVESGMDGHFLGTIVVSPNQEDKKKFDIIDGQQRTTTIFMLLYVLIYKSNLENYPAKFLLDDKNNPKLEVAPQNQDFFKQCLKESKEGNLSQALLDKADTQGKRNLYDVCQSIIDGTSKLTQDKIETYINTLLDMILMWLEEPNSGKAIRTFQSVNDRGVPLVLLDKLKSLLIYYSNLYCNGEKDLDSKINEVFGDIFKIFLQIENHKHISSIGNQQFSESDIFRYHAGSKEFKHIGFIGHYDNSNENTYNVIKQKLKEMRQKDNFDYIKSFIEDYILDLKNFYQAFLDLLNDIDRDAEIFKLFLLEKINPRLYNSLVRLKMNGELSDKMIKLFAKADIIFFKSGSSKDGTAYNLINKYLQGGEERLQCEIIKQCKSNIREVIGKMIQYAYNDISCFHYIFFEQNCKDMNIDYLKNLIEDKKKQITQEKEHIIPLNILEKENEVEAKALGFDNLDDLRNHINSYGNLLSLENQLNKEAQDKSLFSKADVYKKSKIHFIRKFDVTSFNKAKLKECNEQIKEWLENEFFKEFLE